MKYHGPNRPLSHKENERDLVSVVSLVPATLHKIVLDYFPKQLKEYEGFNFICS